MNKSTNDDPCVMKLQLSTIITEVNDISSDVPVPDQGLNL